MAKAPTAHIPQSADELDAAWFSEHLETGDAHVTAVKHSVIGTGIGFLGELFRCELTYDRDDPSLPTSVIAKIPSPILANRSVGEGLGVYEREIAIYRDLGGELGVRMPHHHHSAFDPDPAPWLRRPILFLFTRLPVGGVNWVIKQFLKLSEKSTRRYLLVMEDVTDARPPTQVEGGSLDDVHQALELLAQFHAANWQRPIVDRTSVPILPVNELPKVWQASYVRNRPDFIERFGQLVGDDMIARLDEVQEHFTAHMDPLGQAPCTVLHGDYRLDNLLFRPDGEVVVLDYQMITWGRPGWDVAYFITTALSPDHAAQEEALLRTYHDALVAAGVDDHPFDDLRHDVARTKLLLAHRMVGSGDTLETRMPIADEVDQDDESFVDLLVTRVTGWLD